MQVGTLVDAVEKTGPIEFKWTEGAHATTPPENFASYFGPPPWLRHFEYDGVSALDSMITKVRDFPAGLSAEDTIRRLVSKESMSSKQAVRETMDRMIKVLDEDPSIDVRLQTTHELAGVMEAKTCDRVFLDIRKGLHWPRRWSSKSSVDSKKKDDLVRLT